MLFVQHIIVDKQKNLKNTFIFLFSPADVVPSEQIIDIGRQARLECLTEERDRGSIVWRKDGRSLPGHARVVEARQVLQVFNLQREDYGMYQCFVRRGGREAQAASELRLGGEDTLAEKNNTNRCWSVFCIN